MAVHEYYLPKSPAQALDLLAEHGSRLLVMAGGTIAMPLINDGISMPEMVMGLRHAGLNTIRAVDGAVHLGSTTTLARVGDETLAPPLVREAVQHIGGWQIRNMGTIGGNLFAPPPAGDLAVALLALDASVKIVGATGERVVPLSEFYTGFMATAVGSGELVTEVQVPRPEGLTSYVKYARKHANTPAIVTVATHIVATAGGPVTDARIALNAVGPHPIRARHAERALIGAPLSSAAMGEAARVAATECEPFTDAIATDWYRRRMAEVFVRRALESIGA